MAWRAFRLVPDDTNIDFVGFRKIALALSVVAILATVVLLATRYIWIWVLLWEWISVLCEWIWVGE